MTLTERLKGTLDKLITLQHYGFLNHCHVRCVDEAIVMLVEQDRLLQEGKAIVLGLAAERDAMAKELAWRRAAANVRNIIPGEWRP